MKILLILILLTMAFGAVAETKIVKPNLKLGHWVITIDRSAMLDGALAEPPEGEGDAQSRAMMEQFTQGVIEVDHCMTRENLNDFDKSTGADDEQNSCEVNVLQSSKRKSVVLMECDEFYSKVTTNFLNPKKYESTIVSRQYQRGKQSKTTISSIARWQSASCPDATASAGETGSLLGREINEQAQRQKSRIESRAQQAGDRAVDKGVDKVIDKIFDGLFN